MFSRWTRISMIDGLSRVGKCILRPFLGQNMHFCIETDLGDETSLVLLHFVKII